MIRARQPRAQCGDQDTERRGKGVQPLPRIINKAIPLQEIPAAAEGNEVILPGVVCKQGERDRDGERHGRDRPIEVSPLHTAKGGSMSGADLRLVDVTKNRSHSVSSRALVEESRHESFRLTHRDPSTHARDDDFRNPPPPRPFHFAAPSSPVRASLDHSE